MPLRNPFYKRYVKFTLLAFFMVAFLPIASASIWDVDTEQKIVRSYNVADSAVPCNYVPNELTLTASKDNTLYESASGALSNGKGEYIFAGSTNLTEVGVRRALIAFDLSNQLLSSATIISASLELNMSKSLISESEVGLHRVLANWGEGQSDAENEEGAGAEATIGDATWLHTFYDSETWDSEGGDFVQTTSAAQTVSITGNYTWGTADPMVEDVQGWVRNPATNFGWILIGDESTLGTAKRFDSSENSVVANRPRLTISYLYTECNYLPLILN